MLFPSQRCGTTVSLVITYQNGSTHLLGVDPSVFWTDGITRDFVLDAAGLDGSSLALPTPTNSASGASFQEFSPAPLPDQAALIPVWAPYKLEVFLADTDEPSYVAFVRGRVAAENAAEGVNKAWPTLDANFVNAALRQGGSAAGE